MRNCPPPLVAPLALFALLFFVYQLNLRQVSPDGRASKMVPISILEDGDFDLDEFHLTEPGEGLPRFLVRRGAHVYDAYPPVASIVALPVYALPVWLGIPANPGLLGDVASKVAASAMAGASAVALWLALLSLGHSTRVAWFVCVAYGLGTSVWSTASQGLWAHSPAVLAFAVGIWLESRGRSASGLAALAVGGVSRPVMLLLLPVWLAAVAGRPRPGAPGESMASWARRAARTALPAAVMVLAGLGYNVWLTGSPTGTAEQRNAFWTGVFGARSMWDGNFVEGATGLLVSPSRGLLVYSPIVLLALIGIWRIWRKPAPYTDPRHVRLVRAASAACVIGYLAYSQYLMWWAGHAYGPRYLTDIMPFMGVLMALGLETPVRGRSPAPPPRQRVPWGWLVLAVYSIAVQAIGAFCWPSAREGRTDLQYYGNLWDWRRTQIVSCLETGPRFDPVGVRLLARLGIHAQARPQERD